jgi:hypothetical protein
MRKFYSLMGISIVPEVSIIEGCACTYGYKKTRLHGGGSSNFWLVEGALVLRHTVYMHLLLEHVTLAGALLLVFVCLVFGLTLIVSKVLSDLACKLTIG